MGGLQAGLWGFAQLLTRESISASHRFPLPLPHKLSSPSEHITTGWLSLHDQRTKQAANCENFLCINLTFICSSDRAPFLQMAWNKDKSFVLWTFRKLQRERRRGGRVVESCGWKWDESQLREELQIWRLENVENLFLIISLWKVDNGPRKLSKINMTFWKHFLSSRRQEDGIFNCLYCSSTPSHLVFLLLAFADLYTLCHS